MLASVSDASQAGVPSVLPSSTKTSSQSRPVGRVARRLASIACVRDRQLYRGTTNETLGAADNEEVAGIGRQGRCSGEEPAKVLAVAGFSETFDLSVKGGAIQPALTPADFLETGYLEALSIFDDVDKLRRIEE